MKPQLTCAVVAAAVAIGLTGCSGSTEGTLDAHRSRGAERAADSSEPAGASEPAVDPGARKAVKSAFRGLVRANTGRFDVDVPLGDGFTIREQGVYRLTPLAYDVTRVQTSPEGSIRMAYRGVGDERWVRMESATAAGESAPGWPCWVDFDDVSKLGGSVDLSGGLDGQPPAAVVAASYGVGTSFVTPTSIDGTADLALTLGLLGSKTLAAFGVDPHGDATVPATFTTSGGTLAEIAVPFAELPSAIDDAGGELPAGLDALAQAPGAITIRFRDSGISVDVHAPPAEQIVTFEDADDFGAALQACGTIPGRHGS